MLILRTLAGSRAYGLATPESDYDFHEVFVTPTSELLSLGSEVRRARWEEKQEGADTQAWELSHFLHLATKCNPTVLETFVAPIVYDNAAPTLDEQTLAHELRGLLPYVLSRQLVHDAFRGYAHNQRAKLFTKPDDPTKDQPSERAWKFAAQYLRVLIVGERLLRTGNLTINMNDYHGMGIEILRRIRRGNFTLGEVIDLAKDIERDLEKSFAESNAVPEKPRLEVVNDFLLKVRREHW